MIEDLNIPGTKIVFHAHPNFTLRCLIAMGSPMWFVQVEQPQTAPAKPASPSAALSAIAKLLSFSPGGCTLALRLHAFVELKHAQRFLHAVQGVADWSRPLPELQADTALRVTLDAVAEAIVTGANVLLHPMPYPTSNSELSL